MTIGAGILGFAHSHVITYCRRWTQEPALGVRVVAGWDHDAERAKTEAANFALEICDSPQALVGRGDVDAVIVGAETARHAELVELAAAAGKAVVVQKPLALTLEQADRVVKAVEDHRVPFTLVWQMRADPQNLKMKSLIRGGVVGRVLMVRRRHGLSTHLWQGFENTWHVDPAANRDMWADDASHPIDFIYWLLGMPASVVAEIDTLVNPKVPMDNGIAVFRYRDGAFAEVCCSFTCVAAENTTEIVGEKGVIIQNYGDAPSANVPRPEGAAGLKWYVQGEGRWTISDIPSPASHGERIAALAAPLADFLNGRRSAICTAHEGRDTLRMVLACYESAAQGRRVLFSGPA